MIFQSGAASAKRRRPTVPLMRKQLSERDSGVIERLQSQLYSIHSLA